MTDDCLFCSIVSGDVPSDTVAESDHAVAFRDVNPQAPTHVLVVPRMHLALARRVAEEAGGSYRLVFNTGAEAQQSVFHCHAHVLAGRELGWPPG